MFSELEQLVWSGRDFWSRKVLKRMQLRNDLEVLRSNLAVTFCPKKSMGPISTNYGDVGKSGTLQLSIQMFHRRCRGGSILCPVWQVALYLRRDKLRTARTGVLCVLQGETWLSKGWWRYVKVKDDPKLSGLLCLKFLPIFIMDIMVIPLVHHRPTKIATTYVLYPRESRWHIPWFLIQSHSIIVVHRKYRHQIPNKCHYW